MARRQAVSVGASIIPLIGRFHFTRARRIAAPLELTAVKKALVAVTTRAWSPEDGSIASQWFFSSRGRKGAGAVSD
jgi:hypothetical protein